MCPWSPFTGEAEPNNPTVEPDLFSIDQLTGLDQQKKQPTQQFTPSEVEQIHAQQPALGKTDLGAETPGTFDVFKQSATRGLREGLTNTADALTKNLQETKPPEPTFDYTSQLLQQGISQGWKNPDWWVAHLTHGVSSSSPTLGAGLAGAGVGSVIGPEGTLIGGAGGLGVGAYLQSLVPAYQAAIGRGLSHDEAVHEAVRQSKISGTFSTLMGLAPGVSLFGRSAEGALERPISEALAQIFGVQPSLVAGQKTAQQLVATGELPTNEELNTAMAETAGVGALLTGAHAGGRALYDAAGRTVTPQAATGEIPQLPPPTEKPLPPDFGTSGTPERPSTPPSTEPPIPPYQEEPIRQGPLAPPVTDISGQQTGKVLPLDLPIDYRQEQATLQNEVAKQLGASPEANAILQNLGDSSNPIIQAAAQKLADTGNAPAVAKELINTLQKYPQQQQMFADLVPPTKTMEHPTNPLFEDLIPKTENALTPTKPTSETGAAPKPQSEVFQDNGVQPSTMRAVVAPLGGFYSPVQQSLQNLNMSKAPPQQWQTTLEKDPAAKREMDAMGFSTWLEEQPKGQPVTKQQVQDWLNANKVEVVSDQRSEMTGDAIKSAAHRIWPPGQDYGQTLLKIPGTEGQFTTKHFGDNEFVFIMHSDRTGPKGEKLFMPEQVQSDVHNRELAAKKVVQEYDKEIARYNDPIREAKQELSKVTGDKSLDDIAHRTAKNRINYFNDKISAINEKKRQFLQQVKEEEPTSPFKGDLWWQLALKWSLREAAAKGYGGLILPTAKQVAQASGGQEHKLATLYDTKIPSWFKKYITKLGGTIEQVPINQFQDKVEQSINFPASTSLVNFLNYLYDYADKATDTSQVDPKIVEDFLGRVEISYNHGQPWQKIADKYLDDKKNKYQPIRQLLRSGYTTKDGRTVKPLASSATVHNYVVRFTPQMRDTILGKGQSLFGASEVAQKAATKVANIAGKAVNQLKPPAQVPPQLKGQAALTQAKLFIDNGRHITVPAEIYKPLWDAVDELGPLIPENVPVVALNYVNNKGNSNVVSTYKTKDNKKVINLTSSDNELLGTRAFVNTTDDGRSTLFITRFNGSDLGKNRLIGELWHEAVHALRRQNLLFGNDWDRLLRHMFDLKILEMDYIDFFRSIGSKEGTDEDRGVSLGVLYSHLYENAYPNDDNGLAHALAEEGVAHMIELAQHGKVSLEPVQDIIDRMAKGQLQKNPKAIKPTGPVYWAASEEGTKKRVTEDHFAQALQNNPHIQILDTPYTGYDYEKASNIEPLFRKLSQVTFDEAVDIKKVAKNGETQGYLIDIPGKSYSYLLTTKGHMIPATQQYLQSYGVNNAIVDAIIGKEQPTSNYENYKAITKKTLQESKPKKAVEIKPLTFEEFNQQPDITKQKLHWTPNFQNTVESVAQFNVNGEHKGYIVKFNGNHAEYYVEHKKDEVQIFNPDHYTNNGHPWSGLDSPHLLDTLSSVPAYMIGQLKSDLHKLETTPNTDNELNTVFKKEDVWFHQSSLAGENYQHAVDVDPLFAMMPSRTFDKATAIIQIQHEGEDAGYLIKLPNGYKFLENVEGKLVSASQGELAKVGLSPQTVDTIISYIKNDIIRDANKPAKEESKSSVTQTNILTKGDVSLVPIDKDKFLDTIGYQLHNSSWYTATKNVFEIKIKGVLRGYLINNKEGDSSTFYFPSTNQWTNTAHHNILTFGSNHANDLTELIAASKKVADNPIYQDGPITLQDGYKDELVQVLGHSIIPHYIQDLTNVFKATLNGENKGYVTFNDKDPTVPPQFLDVGYNNWSVFGPKTAEIIFGQENVSKVLDLVSKAIKGQEAIKTIKAGVMQIPEGYDPPKYKTTDEVQKNISPLANNILQSLLEPKWLEKLAPGVAPHNLQVSQAITKYIGQHTRTLSPAIYSQLQKVAQDLVPQPKSDQTGLTVPAYKPGEEPTAIKPRPKIYSILDAYKSLQAGDAKIFMLQSLQQMKDSPVAKISPVQNIADQLQNIGPEWVKPFKKYLKTLLDNGYVYGSYKPEIKQLQKSLTPLKPSFKEQIGQAQDPALQQFTFVGNASGGTKPKEVWKDTNGKEYMFKPVSKGEEFLAYAEALGGQISKLIDPQAPQIFTIELKGRFGSIQEYLPNKGTMRELRLKPNELTVEQIKDLQREQIVDWLISNHDSHDNQFLVMNDGSLVGIDKGQAFKYFGQDKLSIDYHPNAKYGEKEPIYNTIWRDYKNGGLTKFRDEIQQDESANIAKQQSKLDAVRKEYESIVDKLKDINEKIDSTHAALNTLIKSDVEKTLTIANIEKHLQPFVDNIEKLAPTKLAENEYFIPPYYYQANWNLSGTSYMNKATKLYKDAKKLNDKDVIKIATIDLQKGIEEEDYRKRLEDKLDQSKSANHFNGLTLEQLLDEGEVYDINYNVRLLNDTLKDEGYTHIIGKGDSNNHHDLYVLPRVSIKLLKLSDEAKAGLAKEWDEANFNFGLTFGKKIISGLRDLFLTRKGRKAFDSSGVNDKDVEIASLISFNLNNILSRLASDRIEQYPQKTVSSLLNYPNIEKGILPSLAINIAARLEPKLLDAALIDRGYPPQSYRYDLETNLSSASLILEKARINVRKAQRALKEALYAEVVGTINKIQDALDDEVYTQLLMPYAKGRFGKHDLRTEAFLDYALHRKNTLANKFFNFYMGLENVRELARPHMESYAGGKIQPKTRKLYVDIRKKLPKFNNLTDAELRALQDYTGSAYGSLNRNLREEPPITEDGHVNPAWEGSAEYAALITSAINKLPPYENTVWRRESKSSSTQTYPYKVGHIWVNKQFLSATTNKVNAGDQELVFVIDSKTGRQVHEISLHPNEDEVLFAPDKQFLVTKIYVFKNKYSSSDMYEIHLEELPEMDFNDLD